MLSTTETVDLRDGKIPSGPLRKSLPNLALAKPVDSRNVEQDHFRAGCRVSEGTTEGKGEA